MIATFPHSPGRLEHGFDLLLELVLRDIKLRYKRSVLGIGWSLLNPLCQLAVFYWVFRFLLAQSIPDYSLFLFTGILPWTWLQSSLHSASSIVCDNSALVRQPGFRPAILPVVAVTSNLVNFVLALPIVFAFLLATGKRLNAAVLGVVFVMAVQFVLTLAISYLLAAVHVRFRDTQYLAGVLLMLGFYLAPVFYNPAAIPASYQWIYNLNPVVHLLEAYRAILLHGVMPGLAPLIVIGTMSALGGAFTCRYFIRASRRFIEEL